jgi:hypothetical protein
MRRCDYCGGKLGLIVHRRWRLRFCKLACKNAYEFRQRKQIRHRRRRLDTSTSMSVLLGLLHRYHIARERVRYGLLPLNPICNPFEVCFVPVASFARSCATNGYLPIVGLNIESLPQLPPNKYLFSSSITKGMRNLFLPLSVACAGILQRASAQLLAPIVESSLLVGDTAVQGIGIRLVRDGQATLCSDNVPAPRQCLGYCPLFPRLH